MSVALVAKKVFMTQGNNPFKFGCKRENPDKTIGINRFAMLNIHSR